MIASPLPSIEVCERARKARDPRFDGLFFTAVRSTRIFCRVSCPAPAPKAEHIAYFASAAAAAAAGFRPCLRCRPELAPGPSTRGEDATSRAVALIHEGFLRNGSVDSLARHVGISPRQLRRRCIERTGASPIALHGSRRVMLAKQLITDTDLAMTAVADAAGFDSLRRFNDAFKATYRIAPSALRRRPAADSPAGAIRLRLGYRPPFDVEASLREMRARALPGIERVDERSWARAVGRRDRAGQVVVSASPSRHELRLDVTEVPPDELEALVARVRRMFDLDADIEAASQVLAVDPRLRRALHRSSGRRIAGAWDGFEGAVAVLLQPGPEARHPSSELATLIDVFGGTRRLARPGTARSFPSSAALATADLWLAGIPGRHAGAIRKLALAVSRRQVSFAPGQCLDDFVGALLHATGISVEAAHRIAMVALASPDAWPVAPAEGDSGDRFRPWRSYAWLLGHAEPARVALAA